MAAMLTNSLEILFSFLILEKDKYETISRLGKLVSYTNVIHLNSIYIVYITIQFMHSLVCIVMYSLCIVYTALHMYISGTYV